MLRKYHHCIWILIWVWYEFSLKHWYLKGFRHKFKKYKSCSGKRSGYACHLKWWLMSWKIWQGYFHRFWVLKQYWIFRRSKYFPPFPFHCWDVLENFFLWYFLKQRLDKLLSDPQTGYWLLYDPEVGCFVSGWKICYERFAL